MKMAIAIQAHKNPEQINRLIDILSDDDIHIYIHLDNKSNIKNIINFNKNVFMVEDSVNVEWGKFSQVEATLKIFDMIKKSKYNYKYIHLISGQDIVLKNKDEFKNIFKNTEKEYVEYSRLPNGWPKGGKDRYEVYYPSWMIDRTSNLIKRFIRIIYREIIMTTKVFKRKFKFFNNLYGGSQWFSITGDCFNYVMDYLEVNDDYIKFFKNTLCSDEFFFHTIILNSCFYDNVENNNLRYIDWSLSVNGSPKNLVKEDIDKALLSKKVFARKIEDIEIVDYTISKLRRVESEKS